VANTYAADGCIDHCSAVFGRLRLVDSLTKTVKIDQVVLRQLDEALTPSAIAFSRLSLCDFKVVISLSMSSTRDLA